MRQMGCAGTGRGGAPTWRARGFIIGLLLAGLALTGVSGCKRDANGQLPALGGEAIQARRASMQGFGLVGVYPDQQDGELAIALELSRALVGTQDFDALLTVKDANDKTVKGSWLLDEDGKTLRFPAIEPGKQYKVLVRAGLTAADGSRIGAALVQKVYTGPLDPVAGFASQGSVLPARESRGLPVVSVNVREVDVEFLRVADTSLPKFFAEYQRGGRRGSWELESGDDNTPLSELAAPVYVNRFVLGGKPNERLLTYLPVQDIPELQEPGLYFASMKRAGSFEGETETAFFTVSDIGLHTRAYKDQLFVHTASLASGAPIGDVELRILNAAGEPILKGRTDGNGNARLRYSLDAAHVLIARHGKDVSLLPFNQPALDLSEFAVAGRQQAWFDVFVWSGRDLYRPGETVRLSALLRDHDGSPVKDAQPLFLRLKQPDGKTFVETRLQPGVLGYYRFEAEIPFQAPTGRWQVEFRADPASKEAVQGMSLRIEEFLPERMKLDLDAQPRLAPGQPLQLEVSGAYLYGAPAAGNRFTAKLAVAVEQHPLDNLPGYFFGDPTLELPKEAKEVIDTTLDAQGRLQKAVVLPPEARPVSPIAAIVSGSLYETGGRTVTRTLKRVLWPAAALVGVRPLFDDEEGADANSTARFELVHVDAQGRPQPARGLRVSLVREHRDYHWNYDDEGGWDQDFTRRFETVRSSTIDIGSTTAKFEAPVEWGEYRLEVFDPATKLTTRYPFTAGWSWEDSNRGTDARPDKVKLSLDKTHYRAGDTLKVTLTPPHPGRGLLLVESDTLLYVQDISVKAGSTFAIPITRDWERHDVYVTALVFRGGSAPSKITPARAVGVAHVPMDRRARRVAVGLSIPKQMQPQRRLRATIAVPQLAGREAYVTLSAVDVGILNITRFPVPDANAHFFAQRRLGVDAFDVYGRVIESFEGGIARIRFGGDMPLEALSQARRPTSRVQTVDLFAGPVKLDARGIAQVPLAVPDFNGTLRVSALVFAADRYGNRDRELLVRAPVVAEASMPRILAPGDRSTVTLDVQNFTGKRGDFKVQVNGEGPLSVGGAARTITLAPEQKTTLSFPLTAKEGYSTAQVRVRVDGGNYKVDRRHDLPVRPAWPGVVRARTRTIDPIAPLTFDPAIAEGLMPESVEARMSVSALPPIPFASVLKGALDYPYGCAEQTTSKGYAALLLDLPTAKMIGVRGLDAGKRRARMEGALSRLTAMQVGNGHFAMWGDNGYVNPALTPYVAEFLLDAREAGFAVPDAVLQKALKQLNEDLLGGGAQFYGYDHRPHMKLAYQAHAGYVLARVSRAPLGTLRALYADDRDDALTGLPLVHLGLALALQGDAARGRKAIAEGFALRRPRPEYLGDYGTQLRDAALMIALTHERGFATPAFDARIIEVGRELDARRDSGWMWLSTQEQVALGRVGKALLADQTRTFSGRVEIGGSADSIAATKLWGRSFDYATLARGVRFTPVGQAPLYASLEAAGVPRTAPAFDASLIRVERSWYTPDGKSWAGGALREGDALIVAVSMTAARPIPDALLTDLLPAGLEIENFNLGDAKQWADVVVDGIEITDRASAAEVRHEEYRDDRYVAALKLDAHQQARVFYLVRAVTPGTYTVPPPLVEDMYRPEVRGVGKSSPATVTVAQP